MTRSVDRALALIEVLEASSQQGASLMELVERTGVDKSTVTRLLDTCRARGWVVRDQLSRRYTLGPTLLAMARRGVLDDRVMITVYEVLTRVRDATGETAGFHRRAGDRRVAIAGVESQHDVRRGFNAGESCSLLVGPASKAILAFLPEAERLALLADAHSVVGADVDEVEAQVRFLHEWYYLSTDSDRTAGVGAIASPVFDSLGVAGSVVSSGPTSRFDTPARERARTAILAAADTITRALGGRRPGELPRAPQPKGTV